MIPNLRLQNARKLPRDSSRDGINLIPTKMENSPGLRCTHSTLSGPESMANHLPGSRSTPPRFTTTGKDGLVPRTTFHGSKSGLELPRKITADFFEV